MAVTAEVKTGERRILEFLLDPLIEVSQGAFHERRYDSSRRCCHLRASYAPISPNELSDVGPTK
jgi:hypothetical protein